LKAKKTLFKQQQQQQQQQQQPQPQQQQQQRVMTEISLLIIGYAFGNRSQKTHIVPKNKVTV
jgi:hypothetical protein